MEEKMKSVRGVTKYHGDFWDCAQNVEQTSTKDTSSKHLKEKVRPIWKVLTAHGQQQLVYHNEEELPPHHSCARQEAISGFACHSRRPKIQADDGMRLIYVLHAMGYKVDLLRYRTAASRKGHEKGKQKDMCCSYHLLGWRQISYATSKFKGESNKQKRFNLLNGRKVSGLA